MDIVTDYVFVCSRVRVFMSFANNLLLSIISVLVLFRGTKLSVFRIYPAWKIIASCLAINSWCSNFKLYKNHPARYVTLSLSKGCSKKKCGSVVRQARLPAAHAPCVGRQAHQDNSWGRGFKLYEKPALVILNKNSRCTAPGIYMKGIRN